MLAHLQVRIPDVLPLEALVSETSMAAAEAAVWGL